MWKRLKSWLFPPKTVWLIVGTGGNVAYWVVAVYKRKDLAAAKRQELLHNLAVYRDWWDKHRGERPSLRKWDSTGNATYYTTYIIEESILCR
jgi:hypothetical protein